MLFASDPAPRHHVVGLKWAGARMPCRAGWEVSGERSTWLALGLSGLSRTQVGLGGSSPGPAMDSKAGAVLGLTLPAREGNCRAGHRLHALGMSEVANAID